VSPLPRLVLALLLLVAPAALADPPLAITVGDSVVETYPVPWPWPVQGWGADLPAYVSRNIVWRNDARGGESSKSFVDGGYWTLTLDAHPRFILIQLGSNDASPDPAHYTVPFTTYRVYLHRMASSARAAGAMPIFLTPLALRYAGPDGFHITRPNGLEDYVNAMIAQGAEDGVPVIDMFTWSMDTYDAIGIPEAQATYGFLIPDGPYAGYPDVVHFNYWGADQCAQAIAARLRDASPELAAHLTSDPLPVPVPALPWPAAASVVAACAVTVAVTPRRV
jgi:lysophospholipase L1-like esterase